MNLANIIFPDFNVSRSVNLERDRDRIGLIEDYQITGRTEEILNRLADALEGEKINAWSLTGPYGMGKSAFVNFLLALIGPADDPRTQSAFKRLEDSAASLLYDRLHKAVKKRVGDKGFFRIPITAAYEPLNKTLARSLRQALLDNGWRENDKLVAKLNKIEQQKQSESSEIVTAYKQTGDLVQIPLVLVIDEFGKNLDYLSHHHDKGDIYAIQQLSEMKDVYIWVCLHQAFNEYASGLSSAQQQEWSKVQGRFEDINFQESVAQMIYLTRRALRQETEDEQKQKIQEWAQEAKDFISNTYMMNQQDFDPATISAIYPLHPVTALALIEMCRRFAQNDRTLLSFLCGGDRYALPSYLERNEFRESGRLPAVGLDYLYDYFFNITSVSNMNRPEMQKWLEIDHFINDAGSLNEYERAILKTIGVLNLLPGEWGIKAGGKTICALMEMAWNAEPEMTEDFLNKFTGRGTLLYREYAGEYRLWEGSDIEVYKLIREKKAYLAGFSLEQLLQEYLPLFPVIASRHTYHTGTVRRFERRWLKADSLDTRLIPQQGYDGLFLYCFGNAERLQAVPDTCQDGRPLLIAYAPMQAALNEMALEVAAARLTLKSSELEHDSVAKREVKFRIKNAEEQFRTYLQQLYYPGAEEILWFSEGLSIDIPNARALSTELSRLCDVCYHSSPYIGNEMISYENLSSAAARARRELVEAMALHEGEDQLGLKGFGPEVAIYRSLLLARGLHVQNAESGRWSLTLDGNDPHLAALWHKIDESIQTAGDDGAQVSQIIKALQEPPFGMRQGPIPVYLCLYLLVKVDEIAVFQEGIYKPYMNGADMALMVKRPDLFVLKVFVSDFKQKAVFETYHNILNTTIRTEEGLRNATMLGVVGPLVKFIEGLPNYSRKTRQLSREAQRVRAVIDNSTEPLRLLFEELPAAVGMKIDEESERGPWQEELKERLRAALQELEEAFPRLIIRVQQIIENVFNAENVNEVFQRQNERGKKLAGICDESELKAVLKAIARDCRQVEDWIKGLAGIVIKKPMDAWYDDDVLLFASRLREYAERMLQLETLASVNGFLLPAEQKLVSIMNRDGRIHREIISNVACPEVENRVNEIMSLPDEQLNAILFSLIDRLWDREAQGE